MNLELVRPAPPIPKIATENIAVVGLGYVGLQLAVALAEKYHDVVGFDIDQTRVGKLCDGVDWTNEVDACDLAETDLTMTFQDSDLADATVYIVTVPTPVDQNNRPDLTPLASACAIIGKYLKKGDTVVFESKVYPGATEQFCGPILARKSGLRASKDFWLGYSPERVNPGDKGNPLAKIIKVVSGDTEATVKRISAVYENIIDAGICHATSIKVAEAAKVIENTQRDLNIALANELAKICHLMGISTADVIETASSKWNFLPYQPGLVGGHCIGVDPYYLVASAEGLGYNPEVILSGRRVNESMPTFIVENAIRLLATKGTLPEGAKVGVFGLSFKENVPDIRNSKVIEVIRELKSSGVSVAVNDPLVDPMLARELGIDLVGIDTLDNLDLAILATPHQAYVSDPEFVSHIKPDGILMDVKSALKAVQLPDTMEYWCL